MPVIETEASETFCITAGDAMYPKSPTFWRELLMERPVIAYPLPSNVPVKGALEVPIGVKPTPPLAVEVDVASILPPSM
jgi:hypothetical protein